MTEGRDDTPSWTQSPSAAGDVRWFLLLRLRWIAAAGQAATVAATQLLLAIDVPILPLAALIFCTLASNAVSWFWSRRRGRAPRSQLVGGLLLADVLILTGMLYVTGGPENPFTSLYLVHIVLAALMLPPRWTLALSVAAVAGYGVLFFFHMPIAMGHAAGHHHHHGGDNAAFELHMRGMWVAFLITASFITYFVVMMSRGRHRMETELAAARERVERNQRLAGLATLAAGAAHELGTPLGTIAVVAKELELRLRGAPQTAELGQETKLIRAEVDRCRDVLARLSDQGGQARGETPEELTAASISEQLAKNLEARGGGPIRFEAHTPGAKVVAPRRALLQSLCNLVRNALEADTDQEVLVTLWSDKETFFASVRDTGTGMAPEVVARAAEPFFSTKEDGAKMGLGLFLAHAVATSLGGDLSIESTPGTGTTVTWSIPCVPAPAGIGRADGALPQTLPAA